MAISLTLTDLENKLFEVAYPVGSILQTRNANNPNTYLWGGSSNWTKIEGRVIIGADSTYKAGSKGGSANHTLTVNQLPAHNHNVYVDGDFSACHTGNNNSWKQMLVNVGGHMGVNCDKTSYTGSGQSVNHMPPYIALYIWERVS